MKKIVFVALGLLGFFAQAQTIYEKGYLVNEKGDTIKGDVKLNLKKEFEVYSKVAFRDEKGIQKTHKPEKVSAYGFKDRNFVKMDYGNELLYYEVLAKGDITFYKLVFEAMYMNQIVNETEYFASKTGNKKVLTVKSSKFKKFMSDWMEDNLEFINAYEENKKLDETKAIEIINQYNAWKASK